MKKPLCSDPDFWKVYSFTMKDGSSFKGSGFNVQEAFESKYPMTEWENLVDWDFLSDEKPEIPVELQSVVAETEEFFEFEDDADDPSDDLTLKQKDEDAAAEETEETEETFEFVE